jgi:hypothetical protein
LINYANMYIRLFEICFHFAGHTFSAQEFSAGPSEFLPDLHFLFKIVLKPRITKFYKSRLWLLASRMEALKTRASVDPKVKDRRQYILTRSTGGRSYICYLLNSTTKFFKINFPFPIWIQQLNYTNYFLKLDQSG